MKSLVVLLVMLFAAPCLAQYPYELNNRKSSYTRYSARYDANPPKIYSGDGTYLGEWSSDKYAPDSVSNPYGRFGSKYSPDSINNKYGEFGRYRVQPVYVYPPRW